MVKKLNVLIVDDSMLFRKLLTDKLSENPRINIIGTAGDAFEAEQKIIKLNPDVVTLDVEMPKMSGLDFLKQIMPKHPVPIVLVSSLNLRVFDALSAGAVDFVRKPDMQFQSSIEGFIRELSTKIFIASMAKIKKPLADTNQTNAPLSPLTAIPKLNTTPNTIIALGTSTGGTETTLRIIKDLPVETPGMLIVQHMPPGFTKMYADRLNKLCKIEVREAKSGDKVKPGLALIAPGDAHMKLTKVGYEYAVHCAPGEKVSGHCPSVDVLFNSMADVFGSKGIGIILTGMGKDGASGLLKMREKGCFTIGQNKESSIVYGMPMEAKKIGAVTVETHCDSVAKVLIERLNKM